MSNQTRFQCLVSDHLLHGVIENSNAVGTPVVIIQGGPGMSYEYLYPIAELLPDHPLVFFNPVAFSHKTDLNPDLLTLDHFVKEVDCIRQHLQYDSFLLFCHSAGTITGLEYALNNWNFLAGAVFISPIFSLSFYLEQMMTLLKQFPENIHSVFKALLSHQTTDPLEIMQAMAYFAEEHMCRVEWPEALINASANTNIAMRDYLWGSNDFVISGLWQDFERREALRELNIPSLLISGEHDFINVHTCHHYASYLPDCKVAMVKKASHNPHFEAPDALKSILHQFFTAV
ncbi:alpha/beta fold hydrolase [Legionella yabuuchiae]|uniref:alpha/beta fold hydrolase n=1 Tax=Legionella yabuuchiae TaxID=376727 RepID=UPI0010560BC2|nr:alpha/beta hydrolase [Legionella yabuuchiae]